MATDLGKAIRTLGNFTGPNLTGTLSKIEGDIRGLNRPQCVQLLDNLGAQQSVLQAAQSVKAIVGQINVVIHALGILRCLPHILEKGERVEYVSLGAGNTGRSFDLETNFRIAEFKFINWRGGSEAVRQDSVFKDLFVLANATTPKRKFLYLLGTEQALKFLNGKRKLDSVLKRHASIHDQLKSKFPGKLVYVKDYFAIVQGDVSLVDVSPWLLELNVEA